MKKGYTLDQILEQERVRKVYGEKVSAANETLQQRLKSAPRLSVKDSEEIEKYLKQIREYNDYTFAYKENGERLKKEFSQKIKSQWDLDSYQGGAALKEYERANFHAMDLKRKVKSMLVNYTKFTHIHPDPETLGHTTISEEYSYSNVDPKVTKVLKTLTELRNYGEEQMHQYTLRQGDPRNLIGHYTNEDMGIRKKK